MRFVVLCLAGVLGCAAGLDAQTGKRAKPPARAPAAAVKKEPAALKCPAPLGTGVTTKREYCDVLSGRDPAQGVIVTIPPHTGTATLRLDLHNRHTYSEQEIKDGRAFAEYTATIGALTLKNDLLDRAVVQSSFRKPSDLLDRVTGSGPGGVKAVAPVGSESVAFTVPADVDAVSLLGERLVVERMDGRNTFTSPGRPVAVVSNATIEYRPAAPKPAKSTKPPAKKKR